ncbi:hypothetical protein JRO89_XS11G0052300 [Xanthoceras sorbifolium]|uniref:Derlin n=1 Tax=Xanthoceras sorbifolium TaxID=99658 RepID=A0ABQ8HER9_9ROSI|nr:hypothetical protein JRO89_XS11G0052300 [Xanthoceras sorbifolium]
MPHRTRPMTALLVFTGLNIVLVSTITPVYDFVCFHPFWERRVFYYFPFPLFAISFIQMQILVYKWQPCGSLQLWIMKCSGIMFDLVSNYVFFSLRGRMGNEIVEGEIMYLGRSNLENKMRERRRQEHEAALAKGLESTQKFS